MIKRGPFLIPLKVYLWALAVTGMSGCLTIDSDFTEKKCRTYVLYPPGHEDDQVSDRIATSWLAEADIKSCDKLIDFEESKPFLALLGAHPNLPPSKILKDEAKRARLVKRFRATHLVELTVKTSASEPSIMAKVYALSPFQEDSLKELPRTVALSKKELDVIKHRHPLRAFFKTLNLLPNSIASGFGSSSISATPTVEKSAHVYETKEVDGLPTFLSSITLRNIQHRYQYDYFDFSVSSFGSLIFNYIDNIVSWIPIENPETFDPEAIPKGDYLQYRVNGVLLAPTLGLDLSGYTPLGTFGFGLGIGPGISHMRSTGQRAKSQLHLVMPFYISYRAFITERFFFTLWTTVNVISPPAIKDDMFTINGRNFFLLGLGYYFAESRSFFRKLL